MSVKLTDRASIPAVIREMTLEEKAAFLHGATTFSTYPIERLGIPSARYCDGGGGVNLRQFWGDLVDCGLLPYDKCIKSASQRVFILNHMDDRAALSEKENELLDGFLAYLKENYTPSGDMPSCFPVNSLLASTWEPEVALEVARALGKEAAAYQIDMLLGTPAINIQRDPRGGRVFEYYSEDPYLTAAFSPMYPIGIQEQGVCADMKHFAVNSQETDRRTVNEIVSERALREIYLPGFKSCIQKGKPMNVMTSYNKINGVSASENKWLLDDVLRKEWGFDGFVVSDWGGVYHWGAALKAGNDLRMPMTKLETLVDYVNRGELDESVLDTAIENILEVLIEMPVMKGRTGKDIDSESSKKAAYHAAAEGIILLKNENTLPLSKTANVAFYGEKSKHFTDCGIGSGAIHTNKTSSMFERTEEILGKERVLFETVSDQTEAVIVTVTKNGQEGGDNKDLLLPEDQQKLMAKAISDAKSVGAKVIAVLNVCAPVEIMDYVNDLDAILLTYFPGQEGARAAADILFGLVNPSGKLAQTYPKYEYDLPSYGNFPGENQMVQYGEGIFVGYRGFDLRHTKPLFAFGHGLSYTSFALTDAKIERDVFRFDEEDTISVSVSVQNTGAVDGSEVVQLYIRDVKSSLQRPKKELKGFKKVFLKAGESKRVTLTLDKESFSMYDDKLASWVVEPGVFEILLGTASDDLPICLPLRAKGKNPYGYGVTSSYQLITQDEKAVEVIFSHLPKNFFSEEDIARQTAYIGGATTMRGAFKMYFVPKLQDKTPEEQEKLLMEICEDLAKIDITDRETQYMEKNVY